MIIEITGQDFDEEVLKSALPVFACFITSQCGPCFAVCLVVEHLAKEYEGRVKFVIINADFFRGGQKIDESLGAVPESMIRPKVDALL